MTIIRQLCAVLGSAAILFAASPASAEPPAASAKQAPAATCDRSHFRVLVDVGHTNDAGGALSARGTYEYVFNFRLAAQIEQKLIDAGFDKAMLMVTTQKPNMGLFQRVALVNSFKPDLLLSIHHDAVPDRFLAN